MIEVRAIQTQYKGYLFRSRLEARWAVFFDSLGLAWDYEVEGFDVGASGWYLPDFRVLYPGRDLKERHWKWFEVKGDLLQVEQEEWERMLAFEKAKELTVLDGAPACRMYMMPSEILTHRTLGSVPNRWCPGHYSSILRPLRVHEGALLEDRPGEALWSRKGRTWWDYRDNFFKEEAFQETLDQISFAVAAARSARFEHGHSGATT